MSTRVLVAIFAALNLLDVVLTYHVLAAGGVEMVPTSAWLIAHAGYGGLAAFKLIGGSLIIYALCECPWKRIQGERVAKMLCIAFALICAWNAYGLAYS